MASETADKLKGLKWAVVLSGVLVLLKGVSGFLCSSTALLASALDSLMDIGISSGNYLSVMKASKPPDSDHAYGHQKIESLASYTQGIVFIFFAVMIVLEAIRKMSRHNPVSHSGFALLAVVLAMGINLLIFVVLHRVEQRTGSLILKAEKAHYSMDILSYCVVFTSILLVNWTGWLGWDVIGGVCLALYLVFMAGQILLQAGNELVDRSLPRRILIELDHLIRNHDSSIVDYHELRTRKVGDKCFVDFHLVLKAGLSLEFAHDITEALVNKIKENFHNTDVTIHEDPETEV